MTDWNAGTVVGSLWDWFCKLPMDEKMQAVAIDDPLWIRLYLKLYKHELKSRKKDRDIVYSVKRDRVNYMYGRLLKQANRAQSASGGGGGHQDPDDSDCPEAMLDRSHGEEFSGAAALLRGSIGSSSGDGSHVHRKSEDGMMMMEEESEEEEIEEALAEEDDELYGALRIAYGEDSVLEEDADVVSNNNVYNNMPMYDFGIDD